MPPTKFADRNEPAQGRYTFDSFPFDDPDVAQAIAHAIALLLRNDRPASPLPGSNEADNAKSSMHPKKRPVSRD
jgi:hypothetical protein